MPIRSANASSSRSTNRVDHLTLRQPDGAADRRHVGTVAVTVDGSEPQHVTLDDRSFSADGQRVDVTPTNGPSTVDITIESIVVPPGSTEPLAAVGFAEIDAGLAPTLEVVRLPTDSVSILRDSPDTPLSYVFTRLRTRPTDRWRSDPEPTMRREFTVPGDRTFTPAVTVRLDQRADDAVLAELLGIDGAARVVTVDRSRRRWRLGRDRRQPGHVVDHTVRCGRGGPPRRRAGRSGQGADDHPAQRVTSPPSPACDSHPAIRRLT